MLDRLGSHLWNQCVRVCPCACVPACVPEVSCWHLPSPHLPRQGCAGQSMPQSHTGLPRAVWAHGGRHCPDGSRHCPGLSGLLHGGGGAGSAAERKVRRGSPARLVAVGVESPPLCSGCPGTWVEVLRETARKEDSGAAWGVLPTVLLPTPPALRSLARQPAGPPAPPALNAGE